MESHFCSKIILQFSLIVGIFPMNFQNFTTNYCKLVKMRQLNLFHFFKASSKYLQVTLPSPNGPLSREILPTAICEANKEVEKTLKNHCEDVRKRGCYQSYDGKQIGNYMHWYTAQALHSVTMNCNFLI